MRKDSLKTLFFVIGILVVFSSAALYISHLFKKLTIELFEDGSPDDDFFIDEGEAIEPVVCVSEDE